MSAQVVPGGKTFKQMDDGCKRQHVFALLDSDPRCLEIYSICSRGDTNNDDNLHTLTHALGDVAQYSMFQDGQDKEELRWLFAYTAGWIAGLGVENVQLAISKERDWQDELFQTGKILFNCASKTVSPKRKLRVLVEEVGEVAEAIDKLEHFASCCSTRPNKHERTGLAVRKAHLTEELIQVAAVAAAWLESLEP